MLKTGFAGTRPSRAFNLSGTQLESDLTVLGRQDACIRPNITQEFSQFPHFIQPAASGQPLTYLSRFVFTGHSYQIHIGDKFVASYGLNGRRIALSVQNVERSGSAIYDADRPKIGKVIDQLVRDAKEPAKIYDRIPWHYFLADIRNLCSPWSHRIYESHVQVDDGRQALKEIHEALAPPPAHRSVPRLLTLDCC